MALNAVTTQVLARSRSYLSPHCDAALAAAVGLSAAYEGGGCSGAVLPYADESALEALRGGIKQHIDASWSAEAVKQGVSHARTGVATHIRTHTDTHTHTQEIQGREHTSSQTQLSGLSYLSTSLAGLMCAA